MADDQAITEMDLLNERIERIRQRAYELWEQDGRPSDRADEYWLQAEQEVSAAVSGEGGGSSDSDLTASARGSGRKSRVK